MKPLCPICKQQVESFEINHNHQGIEVCPDGYDVIGGDDSMPMLIPRSGEKEIMYVAGRQSVKLLPCNCPALSVKHVGGNNFDIECWAPDTKHTTIELRRD